MQNSKKLFFIAILVLGAFVADKSNCAAGGQQIAVKTFDGRKLSLAIDKGDTLADLKRKISDLYGYPIDVQRLLFEGQELPDDTLVKNTKWQAQAVIHLVIGRRPDVEQHQQHRPRPMTPEPAFAPRREILGQRYNAGDFVKVTVKGEPKIGKVKNVAIIEGRGMYTVDTGDKERDFFESEMNPA